MTTQEKTASPMSADDFFLLLGSLIESRRAAFRRRCRVAFAVVDSGAYLVDTGAPRAVEKVWRRDADVSVLCNRRTLSDMVAGKFDVDSPQEEHLFLWGGDGDIWRAFSKAFGGGTTAFGAHLAALSKKESKKESKR